MSGLKTHQDIALASQYRISPDEQDNYVQYIVLNPSTSTTYLGTVAPGTVTAPVIITNPQLDFPRTVLASVTGPSGGVGGTFTVRGQDFTGGTAVETISIGSANGGGSVAGTLIFAKVGTATYVPNGVNNIGTPVLGVAIGTAAGLVARFGLQDKIANTADVKLLTWINNGTPTSFGTLPVTSLVSATTSSFVGTSIVALTDRYVVVYRPSKDLSSEGFQANL